MKNGKKIMILLAIIAFICNITAVYAQRISVQNATLTVDGQQIWINGANTPWDNWNDFGGSYDSTWWNAEFARIKAAGGNATRIWITCSGEVGINIDSTGYVSGATDKHWTDLDDMFALAWSNKIYILATFISFDHTKNTYTTYQNWRNMYSSQTNVSSFITNYVVPFVTRYKDNPYLFAIEPCNEIEWVNQNTDNAQLPWTTLQYFCARVVAAVHENSSILATIGVSMKWQTDVYPNNDTNRFSDALLKAQYNSTYTYLDVYSPHFYDWVIEWFGNPMDSTNISAYGLSDKPIIIGEMPANGFSNGISITDCFENGYINGLQGIMPWTSNGVDSCGSLDSGLGIALTTFKSYHPSLVTPGTTETDAPTPTPYDCSGIPAWDASVTYDVVGTQVVYNCKRYSNNWYSQNQIPEENCGQYEVWTYIGTCDCSGTTAPTGAPVDTTAPTTAPTDVPVDTTAPTSVPTDAPVDTIAPTSAPTDAPVDTIAPTDAPTSVPAATDTPAPTAIPTATPVGVTADPTTPPSVTTEPTSPPTVTDPPVTGCTCTNLCSSTTAITVPFTKDGSGEYCYTASSIGTYVNSWNTDAVNVNGTSCTNTYVSSSSIAAINGVYYIYLKASYSWSHLEIK